MILAYVQDKNNCLNVQGILSSIPTYFGLPFADVKEIQCAAEGANSCIYEITWQNPTFKKRKFFPLLIGIIIVYIIYLFINCFPGYFYMIGKVALFLLPLMFFFAIYLITSGP